MKPKSNPCTCCKRPSDFSVVTIISTLGVKPREQQCGQSISLCKRCLHELCDSDRAQSTAHLREELKRALTALTQTLSERAERISAGKD